MIGLPQRPLTRRTALGLGAGLIAGTRTFSVFSPRADGTGRVVNSSAEEEQELILTRYAELMAGAPDADTSHPELQAALATMRSEERRVGKERSAGCEA